jgi:hypothetical protein
MPYGTPTYGTTSNTTVPATTGNNRGANALSWFQAIGGLGTTVLSVLTGNPAQQKTTINQATPATGNAPAKDNTMYWVIGAVVIVLLIVLYMIFKKK